MALKSSAYFRVSGQSQDSAVDEVAACLRDFDADKYGIRTLNIEIGPHDTISIVLTMISNDTDEADADADRAAEAIVDLLLKAPHRSNWHERQRELTLA